MTKPTPYVLVLYFALACGGDDDSGTKFDAGGDAAAVGDGGDGSVAMVGQDLKHIALTLDLAEQKGAAVIDLVLPQDSASVRLEVGDLEISKVMFEKMEVQTERNEAILTIPVDQFGSGSNASITIEYGFGSHEQFDGWNAARGNSFLWPYFCGSLFPCVSDPLDGLTFDLTVMGNTGVAVYPENIPADAPAYMPAIAVGDYTESVLGTTEAGTAVSVWYLSGGAADAELGTAHLLNVFDFLEKTYGAYTFGDKVASVSANWGGGDYGGMEHHPFWHISSGSMTSEETHAHEAAHGWFGNGVRIECWEDFVLSEGTTTYLAAHALESEGVNVWGDYVESLEAICTGRSTNAIVMPNTCGVLDILNSDLWSLAPYMKGACFYEDVADLMGQEQLDDVLAAFYTAHVNKAAQMEDLLSEIKATLTAEQKTLFDGLVSDWLTTLECPADYAERCGSHGN